MEKLIIDSVFAGICLIVSIIIFIGGIKTKEWFLIILGSFLMITLSAIEILIISKMENIPPEPTAIDVYRGLTELEITSVNGVPKDTVVVFKDR